MSHRPRKSRSRASHRVSAETRKLLLLPSKVLGAAAKSKVKSIA